MLFFSPEVKACKVVPSVNEGDEGSVEFVTESGNSMEVYPHHMFLCIKYPFGTDPNAHCLNCFCVVCEERASDCKDWNAHFSISKEEYKEMLGSRTSAEKCTVVDQAVVVLVPEEELKEVIYQQLLDLEELLGQLWTRRGRRFLIC